MSEAQRAGAFLKKRKDVSLPFRANSEEEVRSRATRSRFATPASIGSQTLSGQLHSEEDEDEDGVDELIRSQPAARQQLLTDSFAQSTSSISLVLNRRGLQSTKRYPQERVELNRSTNSPWTPLALGGNDPFSILPSDLPRKFIDERMHTIPDILAKMVSVGPSGESYGKSWAMNVMSQMKSNLALFYSVVFAEMIHTRVLRGLPRGSAFELEVGTRAIKHISYEMRDPNRAVMDSNIWAVVALGFSGKEARLRTGQKYPRQSFLKELQSLHIYCKMEIIPEHVYGLIKLIELLGGLHKIKTLGMAQVISFCGLMSACRFLQKPIFPFVAHSNDFAINGRLSVSDEEREWVMSTLGQLGSGFWEVWGPSTTVEVNQLCMAIQHICDFTIVVENHVEGRWMPRTFTEIIDQRNFVQHSLMSLKTKQELVDSNSVIGEPLYECCRLAVIVYSFLIIFPLPPVEGPFEALAAQLQMDWIVTGLDRPTKSRSRILLWILVMGAIAAIGLPERPWFLSQIRTLSRRMGIGDWEEIKDVLQSFLWLPRASDLDGQDLWIEMQAETITET